MRKALIISCVFHGLVVMISMIGLPFLEWDRSPAMTVIPVEMVKIADATRLAARDKEPAPKKPKSKPKNKPKEQPERKVEMPPEPPKLASSMPLPDIKPKPEKPVKKPKKVVKKSAQEIARRAPKVAPRAKPSRFDAGKLAARLDKRQETTPDFVEKLKDKDYGPEKIISTIDHQQQTLSIIDAVSQHIYDNQCWNIPAGAKGAEDLRVAVRIRLGADGRLVGSPEVKDSQRMNTRGQEFFRTAAESALRAVLKCAPYDFLPKDQYHLWRDMEIVFDPEQMLNG